jgi:hypothetical protein
MLARNETADAIEHAGAAGFFVKGTDTQRLIDHLLAFTHPAALAIAAVRSAEPSPRPARRRSSRHRARRSSRALSPECDVVGVIADGREVAEAARGFSRS